MVVRPGRCTTSARRAGKEADLKQVRLVHVLDGDGLFTDGGRQRVKTDRSAAVILDDRLQHAAVGVVKTKLVDLQKAQPLSGDRLIDHAVAAHQGKVTDALEQTVGNARRAAGTGGQLACAVRGDLNSQNRSGTGYDRGTPEELTTIVIRSAGILGFDITPDGAYEIASRSRGTPRVANRLLKRVRDFAQVSGQATIDSKIASFALQRLEIDQLGLDNTDRKMMETIIKFYGGGPVGLETLAATVGEEAITLEDVYEPYLLQIGFLSRTPRGRCVTRLAYEHLGLPYQTHNAPAKPAEQIDFFEGSN